MQWSVGDRVNQIALGASYDGSRSSFQQGSALGIFDPTRAVIETGPFELENSLNGQVSNFGLYATDTITVLPNLFVTVSGRYNVAEVKMQDTGPSAPALDGNHRFSSFNPALGASYEWLPALTLYGGFAQGSRAPSPIELGCADPANPCTLPNALASDPPLNQVITRTFELGLRGRIGDNIRWNAGLFQATNTDDILFVGTTTSAGYFTNFGKTRRQGVELGASGSSGPLEWGACVLLHPGHVPVERLHRVGEQLDAWHLAACVRRRTRATPAVLPGRRPDRRDAGRTHAGRSHANPEADGVVRGQRTLARRRAVRGLLVDLRARQREQPAPGRAPTPT